MRPLTIRYVQDMEAAQRFYTALGLRVAFAGRAPRRGGSRWVELVGGHGGLLALHQTDAAADPAADPAAADPAADPAAADPAADPDVELAFEAEEPLEDVVDRLRAAGFDPATAIVDESYGRSFTVRDPEGMKVQINEHDRALHG